MWGLMWGANVGANVGERSRFLLTMKCTKYCPIYDMYFHMPTIEGVFRTHAG